MLVSITYRGVDLEVEGTYTPEEVGRTSGPPENCEEGEPSYFEIEDVLVGETSILEMLEAMVISASPLPDSRVDVLHDLALKVCEICDNWEPDYD